MCSASLPEDSLLISSKPKNGLLKIPQGCRRNEGPGSGTLHSYRALYGPDAVVHRSALVSHPGYHQPGNRSELFMTAQGSPLCNSLTQKSMPSCLSPLHRSALSSTLNGTCLHIGLLDYEHTEVETSLSNHFFKCEELEYHLERTVGI